MPLLSPFHHDEIPPPMGVFWGCGATGRRGGAKRGRKDPVEEKAGRKDEGKGGGRLGGGMCGRCQPHGCICLVVAEEILGGGC